MRLWKSLWDIKLWEGSEDDVNSILHYILFFRAGLNNLSDVSEVEFNWREGLSEADRELYAKRIKEIKEDVAANGLIITREISKCMANSPHAELHLTIPYDIKRDSSHCWDSEAISAIIRAHTVSFLKDDDSKLQKFVYTIQRYGAISYYLDKGCCALNGKDIYISFIVMPTGESDSCIVISCKKLSDYQKVWLYYISQYQRHKHFQILTSSVKSAIGSIMSRNGSHNIGSHVLAALSHNVGTMPDDRVLYQYIQQRMDYIANVTTESPSWSQPTMFLSEMMRTFFSQRHLLSHIAESEGLGAWEFQNKNMDESGFMRQYDRLRFQIRRVKRDKRGERHYTPIIGYENNGGTIDFSQDVALAIPGGVAGQQAFFTILENIVRNAAKHDWSNPPKSTERFKHKKGHEDDFNYGNLNIYIDYEDKVAEGQVEFSIWTNMSDVEEFVDDWQGGDSTKALHNILNKKLDTPFIDGNTGGLRRENWGLAEMRISAGYLQGRKISEIGGIDTPTNPIVRADVHSEANINHLAYRFCVPKPKKLLILVDDELKDETVEENRRLSEIQEVIQKFRNHEFECRRLGVYVKTYSEVKADCKDGKRPRLNYECIVMDDMREEQSQWHMPFRVLSVSQTNVAEARELVPVLTEYSKCADIVQAIIAEKDGKLDIERNIKEVDGAILARWCRYIKSRHVDSDAVLNMVLTVKDNHSGNEGKGLVSKRDVVRFVFEESLNSAIRSFIGLNGLSEKSEGRNKETFIALKDLMNRRGDYIDMSKMDGNDYTTLIFCCLKLPVLELHSDNQEAQKLRSLREVEDEIRIIYANSELSSAEKHNRLAMLRQEKLKIESCENERNRRTRAVFSGFVNYLERVCEQMETILCKYAENISTLPRGFCSEGLGCNGGEANGQVWDVAKIGWWKGPRPSNEQLKSVGLNATSSAIEFIRHFDPNDGDDKPQNRLYAEPLSGSQSYLTTLEKVSFEDKEILTKLTETALLRVLIIDERVAKFLREHRDEVASTYKSMHLYVADEKMVDKELQVLQDDTDKVAIGALKEKQWEPPSLTDLLVSLSSYNIYKGRNALQSGNGRVSEELCAKFMVDGKKLFDVLIVHQGIIDKWFPSTANSPDKVANLLSYLRQLFPYVIITTGRGSPANIPEEARMLPFSTIEATLFRKYPEKLLLIDSVMNILPKGGVPYV